MTDHDLDIVVLGGGVAGLSTAHALQREGFHNVTLMEKNRNVGAEASGMNSGKIRHYHADETTRENLRRNVSLLEQFQKSYPESFFEQISSLWLFDPSVKSELSSYSDLSGEWKQLDPGKEPDVFHPEWDFGQFWVQFHRDGLLDSTSLVDALKQKLDRSDVTIQTGVALEEGRRESGRWKLHLSGATDRSADVLVNATGVWANHVADRLGVAGVDITPVQRHLFYVNRQILPETYGFFWDHVNEYYFRSVETGTVISYCEDSPVEPGEASDLEYPEDHLDNVIGGSYSNLDLAGVDQYWSGHFARTPDRTPVLRRDPGEESLIWATGFNDYGMSMSLRIGERVKEIIAD